jgi:RHS repeat-associated protein
MKHFDNCPTKTFSMFSMRSLKTVLTRVATVALVGIAALASTAYAAKKTVHFYNDIAGSPQMAVDADSGQVLWKENYRPYGERINNSPASATGKGKNELYFHGKQAEPLNGGVVIQNVGMRQFMPGLGDRFMSVDPLSFQEGNIHSFNRFAFANNNPYKFTDPDGHQSMPLSHDPRLFAQQAWARFMVNVNSAADATTSFAAGLIPGSAAYGCMSGGCGAIGWGLAAVDVAGPAGKVAGKVGKVAEGGEKLLFRRGAHDTRSLLETQAEAAERAIGVHGVSVSTSSVAKPGQVVRCATCSEVEAAGFSVHKTGNNPSHYTVELPKPVTPSAAAKFNETFK